MFWLNGDVLAQWRMVVSKWMCWLNGDVLSLGGCVGLMEMCCL